MSRAASPSSWLCEPAECFCYRLASEQDKPLVLIEQRVYSLSCYKMVFSNVSVIVIECNPQMAATRVSDLRESSS